MHQDGELGTAIYSVAYHVTSLEVSDYLVKKKLFVNFMMSYYLKTQNNNNNNDNSINNNINNKKPSF